MPSIPFSISQGCAATGGVVTLETVSSGGSTGGDYFFVVENVDGSAPDRRLFDPQFDLPFALDGQADGSYDAYVEVVGATTLRSTKKRVQVTCSTGGSTGQLVIANATTTAPTAPGGNGEVAFDSLGVAGATDLTVYTEPAPGTVAATRAGIATPARTVVPLPAGAYRFVLTYPGAPAAPTDTAVLLATVPAYVAPQPPVYACTDPEADNYDPSPTATPDLAQCQYGPRLELSAPLEVLVANGRPVPVTLNSAVIPWAVPAKADGYINLENFDGSRGVLILLNGYRLESGPLLLATNWNDAPSLLDALLALPPLAAAYEMRLSQDYEIRLTAREEGSAWNLVLFTSHPPLVQLTTVAGQNRYRSQGKQQWGVFLEVWTGDPASNPSTYADVYTDAYRDRYGLLLSNPAPADQKPRLAQRVELPYRPDNTYTFDIAAALRQFTAHPYPGADGTVPERLTSYYLRYGEVYAKATGGRRQQTVYQSGVGWALDAVEVLPEFMPGARLLSSRPSPWRTDGVLGAPSLLVAEPVSIIEATLGRVDFSGQSQKVNVAAPALGQPARYNWPAGFFAGYLTGTMLLLIDGTEGTLPNVEIVPATHTLTFANGQGGYDSVPFQGLREELTKRTAATYATPTGTATRSASLPGAFRLNSGPLSRAEYLWLRRELGNNPSVWYETADGPQAVNVTGLSPDPDEVKAEYFLAVDCDPCEQPALGLTN